MPVSKLYLYNFSLPHAYEVFFFNVCVSKTNCFFFCPCFFKAFTSGKILKNAVVYEQKPSCEIICICLKCKKEVLTKVRIIGSLNAGMFNDLKKLLIQYFFRVDEHCKTASM